LKKNIKVSGTLATTTRIVLHYQITEAVVEQIMQVSTELHESKKKTGFKVDLNKLATKSTLENIYPSSN
jgi:hypothetical protein